MNQRLSPSSFLRTLYVLPLRQFSPFFFPFELFPIMLCLWVYFISVACDDLDDKLVSFSGLRSHESPGCNSLVENLTSKLGPVVQTLDSDLSIE